MNEICAAVLDVLLVVVPLAGTLIAGTTLLQRSNSLKEERRVRIRIAQLVSEMYPDPSPDPVEQKRNAAKLKQLLLQHHGLVNPPKNYRDVTIDAEMSGTVLDGYEAVSQRVLLWSAMLTVCLLVLRQFFA